MKNKVFLIYVIITVIFFGMLIKLEYATDTYAVFNFDKEEVFMQYAMSGRFITGLVLKGLKAINFSEKAMYTASYILAIFCASLSQYILYKTIEKDAKSKALKLIIPTLIIINPFSIELFLFIEKGLMWLGILVCVLALKNLQGYFEIKEVSSKNKKEKKYLLYCLICMFVANCLYQGIVGIFLSVALVYILKYSKSIRKVASPHVQVASEKFSDFSYAIKEFIVNNVIVGSIYAIPALINYLVVKTLFKESRINGQIKVLTSLSKIGQNTSKMFKTMYGLLPKYTFILLILFTFVLFCSKIWKEKKKFLSILKYMYIVIGITFVAVAPQIMQPTNSIWFGPRTTYCFASMYGILVLYIAINYEIKGIIKNLVLVLSVLLIVFQMQKFLKIEKDRFTLNQNDAKVTMQISEQIKKYEKQTGNTITELSWYEDEKPNYTYSGIFVTCDMNVKCYSSDWSTAEILEYYLKRNIKLVPKDDSIADVFKSKNWDVFDEEQIIFEDNKINICNY